MTFSYSPSAGRALADATLALLAGCTAIAMFLPPLAEATLAWWPRALGAGAVMALAIPWHVWLVGQAARRLGGQATGWVAMALLFPVGGVAALLLLAGQWRCQPPQHLYGTR